MIALSLFTPSQKEPERKQQQRRRSPQRQRATQWRHPRAEAPGSQPLGDLVPSAGSCWWLAGWCSARACGKKRTDPPEPPFVSPAPQLDFDATTACFNQGRSDHRSHQEMAWLLLPPFASPSWGLSILSRMPLADVFPQFAHHRWDVQTPQRWSRARGSGVTQCTVRLRIGRQCAPGL